MDVNKVASSILLEFLEVAVHSILYTREIYPPGVFSRRKKYNVPVQMSCHPELNQYISDLVSSLGHMLQENSLSRVDVVILSKDTLPVEKFVFETVYTRSSCTELGESRSLLQLEQSLRAFLLKLNISDSLLSPLPEGCSWSIQVHVKESAALSMQQSQLIQDFTWVPAEERSTKMPNPHITPLKSSNSAGVQIQLYVEESALKENG